MRLANCKYCSIEYPRGHASAREGIVRAMRDANRWSAVMDANDAMFSINLMAAGMLAEHENHFCASRSTGCVAVDGNNTDDNQTHSQKEEDSNGEVA